MPSIKNLVTGDVFLVSEAPRFQAGTWECGDRRFIDPEGSEYAAVTEYALLTPMTLYMAFTPAERIAIKASKDPYVAEFWEMYQLSVQLQKPTDPNLASVQGAVAYLARSTTDEPPGPGILDTPDRIEQILLGIPQ